MITIPKILLMTAMACSLMACDAPAEDPSGLITIRSANGTSIRAEVADDGNERARGLMFRDSLPADRGMWFVFEEERSVSFWMKNTLIPLDGVFVAADGSIVDIIRMEPCPEEETQCPSYKARANAQFVLEINADQAAELGWSIGDQLEFPLPPYSDL